MNNTAKKSDILATSLSILHNYFDSLTKFFWSVKILDFFLANPFFPCIIDIINIYIIYIIYVYKYQYKKIYIILYYYYVNNNVIKNNWKSINGQLFHVSREQLSRLR